MKTPKRFCSAKRANKRRINELAHQENTRRLSSLGIDRMARQEKVNGSRHWAAFAALQVVIFAAVAGAAVYRGGRFTNQSTLALRAEPIEVRPQYDYEFVITDEQLQSTLRRLGLVDRGAETLISATDHSLRMWGPRRTFPYEPKFLSGPEMMSRLTDHRRFAEVYGADSSPLLIPEETGIRVRAIEGPLSSSHIDHTVACLAEVGTPLDYQVVTAQGPSTFRELVEHTIKDFDLNQVEYEWSALTMTLFLPPQREWRGSDGQMMSFDLIADRIMRERLPRGVCGANHRLHALTMMLRVDDMMEDEGHPRILSSDVRTATIEYLTEVTRKLVAHQHPSGCWNMRWPDEAPPEHEASSEDGDTLGDRLIATGHALEWWSLAPQELHPPRGVLVSASQWIVTTVEGLSDEEIQRYNSYLSHAGRALALWRGRLPGEVDLTANETSN